MSCELRSCSITKKVFGAGVFVFITNSCLPVPEAGSNTWGLTTLNATRLCWVALKLFLINVNPSFKSVQLWKMDLLSFVMNHGLSFCVFLIGQSCILPPAVRKWPLASQLLSGQAWATRAQSHIQDLPEGLLPSPGHEPGKTGQTSMPLSAELCSTFILMDLTNRKCSGPAGLSCWGEEERWGERGGRDRLQRKK